MSVSGYDLVVIATAQGAEGCDAGGVYDLFRDNDGTNRGLGARSDAIRRLWKSFCGGGTLWTLRLLPVEHSLAKGCCETQGSSP
jgi:hypothetical protein